MDNIDPNTRDIGGSDFQKITGKPYNDETDKALSKKFAELDKAPKAQTGDDKANEASKNILGSQREEG